MRLNMPTSTDLKEMSEATEFAAFQTKVESIYDGITITGGNAIVKDTVKTKAKIQDLMRSSKKEYLERVYTKRHIKYWTELGLM